jgi:hypothetical protein
MLSNGRKQAFGRSAHRQSTIDLDIPVLAGSFIPTPLYIRQRQNKKAKEKLITCREPPILAVPYTYGRQNLLSFVKNIK